MIDDNSLVDSLLDNDAYNANTSMTDDTDETIKISSFMSTKGYTAIPITGTTTTMEEATAKTLESSIKKECGQKNENWRTTFTTTNTVFFLLFFIIIIIILCILAVGFYFSK